MFDCRLFADHIITYPKLFVGVCKGVCMFTWVAMHVCSLRPEGHKEQSTLVFEDRVCHWPKVCY